MSDALDKLRGIGDESFGHMSDSLRGGASPREAAERHVAPRWQGRGTDEMRESVILLYVMAFHWTSAGRQRYRLSDSLAALFRMTSAPTVSVDELPHDAFLVEIPSSFVSSSDPSPFVEVLCSKTPGGMVVQLLGGGGSRELKSIDDRVSLVSGIVKHIEHDATSSPEQIAAANKALAFTSAARIVSNVIAFLNESRAGIEGKAQRTSSGCLLTTLRPPRDVVVSRELREAARSLVTSRSLVGVRRAMAHFVRGHWRNQPVGEGRKEIRRTWVKPHKRGDEAFGRVVERITKVTGGEN